MRPGDPDATLLRCKVTRICFQPVPGSSEAVTDNEVIGGILLYICVCALNLISFALIAQYRKLKIREGVGLAAAGSMTSLLAALY